MSFVLGQYNKNFDSGLIEADKEPNTIFMTLVKDGEARRRKKIYNNNVFNDSGVEFFDECVYVKELMEAGLNYYFHCKIKKMDTAQRFDIKLVNYLTTEDNNDEQYIKTIDISSGDSKEWVDVEFIFTPAANFDTILFELTRTTTDYQIGTRYPVIIYQELSKINNIITSEIGFGISLNKIGVQSHPGLMMCINGEQIQIGKTGIYEIKNGIISVSKFSVVNAAVEEESIENILKSFAMRRIKASNTSSECLFGTTKYRSIDAFTLDYMYERGV